MRGLRSLSTRAAHSGRAPNCCGARLMKWCPRSGVKTHGRDGRPTQRGKNTRTTATNLLKHGITTIAASNSNWRPHSDETRASTNLQVCARKLKSSMAATRRRRLLLALVCSVADAEIKGINYGGRFIPEHWLGLPHMRELYEGATPGGDCSPKPCKLSLCDVAASPDGAAGQRMIQYLNRSIQLEHFETMKRMGFNYVRLPLGYWNVVQPTEAPDAPNSTASRWRALELMATPSEYAPYIARVLRFANSTGLQVLLSPGAPRAALSPSPLAAPSPAPSPSPSPPPRCCSTCTGRLAGRQSTKTPAAPQRARAMAAAKPATTSLAPETWRRP